MVLTGSALLASHAMAAPLVCETAGFSPGDGFEVSKGPEDVTLQWSGEAGQTGRLKLQVVAGEPRIAELALRKDGGDWVVVGSDLRPEFSVVSGVRRMSNQQLQPLRDLKVPITQEVLDKYRWDPFWDAPLDLAVPVPGRQMSGNPPPGAGLPGTDQAGLPRSAQEIKRAAIEYRIENCSVRRDGGRIVASFPGVKLGVFDGRLEITVFKGTNLIRQEVIASTQEKWVAYKFDAGLSGFRSGPEASVTWRDTAGDQQAYRFGGAPNKGPVALEAANRIIVAEQGASAIAAFPTPHKFFWAREVAINMGYNWYRKDSEASFSIGVRQNEHEDPSEAQANWALYSARPGTDQLMTLFLYPSLAGGQGAREAAMSFTHGDRYKPLAGYQVMNHHYHMDLGQRLLDAGSPDEKVPDLVALKALGINIVSLIDSVFFQPPNAPPPTGRVRPDQLPITASSIKGAQIHSDKDFLVMANQEVYGSPLGGHTDLLFSRPVYWDSRKSGQPFKEAHPTYGNVYHIGDAADFLQMAKEQDILISMPHPRTKGSTGYPDAIREESYFNDPHYHGVGMRWGMGLDGSERRLCELRCWPLLDDMSNWAVDRPMPLKFVTAISEVRYMAPGDDIYGSQPVSYLRLPTLPPATDPSPVIQALARGDSFWTTGEVLIRNLALQPAKGGQQLSAEVEWTYPLEFVEMVWGDGKTTRRTVIPTRDLAPFASHRFEFPIPAKGAKWVRFAAWDIASNGAVSQPMRTGAMPGKAK
ncbi:MAG: hypothetical protein CFE28_04120 [Alphaproteobacteria bacterium PA2]|nr:MAG: hypothetical protein CFE28_04120 [Alphaproteobacteria bacterium PA2]